jgi:hypothetical protein
MAQPFDYRLQTQDPFASTLNALRLGSAFQEMQQQQRTSALEQQALQQQIQRRQDFANKITDIKSKGIGNASPEDFLELQLLTDEKQAGAIRQGFETLSKSNQQNTLTEISQVLSALRSKRPQVAADILNTRATALRNTGRPQDIRQAELLESQAQLAVNNPDFLEFDLSYKTAFLPGGKEALENVKAVEVMPFEIREARAGAEIKEVERQFADKLQQLGLDEKTWNVRNLQSQINDRAKRLNLDTQVTTATIAEKMSSINKNLTELPADARKLVNEAVTEAATLQQSADRFLNLADQLDAAGGGYGVFSSAKDMFNRTFGVQNGMSQLRQEYTRLRNSAAIKSLPPGPATDKDIEMVLRGFPSENADARTISQFLRGMAKLQEIDAGLANAKTDWLSNNRGALTRAKSGFKVGNIDVAPGESFADVTKRVVGEVSKKYEPRQAAPTPIPPGGPRVQQPVPGTPLINSLLEKYGAQ